MAKNEKTTKKTKPKASPKADAENPEEEAAANEEDDSEADPASEDEKTSMLDDMINQSGQKNDKKSMYQKKTFKPKAKTA